MLTRRLAMTTIAVAFGLVPLPGMVRKARAQSSEGAVAFVKNTSDQLVAIVNGGGSSTEKRLRLQEIIFSSVDVDDIGRFSLGRFWSAATPDQQTQYMVLFRELLVTKIASHLGEYRGVRVTMGPARAGTDSEIVTTTVARPENPPMQVEWVIGTATGSHKIVDVMAEGTSLRQTQNDDFSSYLSHHQHSIQELIKGMDQLVAQNRQ